MTTRRAPQVEVVNEADEPHLLVRATTAGRACDTAQRWIDEQIAAWNSGDFPPGDPPANFLSDVDRTPTAAVHRDGWWRWIPARPGDDYTRWLHPAEPHSRGAFHAWHIDLDWTTPASTAGAA